MPKSINESPARSNRIKVTKRSVESLSTPGRPTVWYDDKLAGFGVRVMPSGRRFYFARYRNKHGRSRWFTIGEHGKVTAEAARANSGSCRRSRWTAATPRASGRPSGRRRPL